MFMWRWSRVETRPLGARGSSTAKADGEGAKGLRWSIAKTFLTSERIFILDRQMRSAHQSPIINH